MEQIHRAEVARSAFDLLNKRFSHRVDDEWLCMNGPKYIAAYVARHGAATGPNLPYDPEIRPEIRPIPDWSGKAQTSTSENYQRSS
jgi:hypothetical protein